MPYLVKLVKNLVKEYVRPQESLVLLACSMESDMANSSAGKLVRGMGAEHRCIGMSLFETASIRNVSAWSSRRFSRAEDAINRGADQA